MNKGDRLKRVLVLCLVILMMAGCAKEEKTVKRAVFAWEGVEEADKRLLENYRIDTIFMDINHYSSIPGYNIYLLAGDPSWGVDDMQKVVEEAEEKRADWCPIGSGDRICVSFPDPFGICFFKYRRMHPPGDGILCIPQEEMDGSVGAI